MLNNSIMTGYNKYLPVAMEEYGIGKLSGDYAKLAESLGAYSERVEEPGEIKAAIARATEQNKEGPRCLGRVYGRPSTRTFLPNETSPPSTCPALATRI